jgi:hypothetical protein
MCLVNPSGKWLSGNNFEQKDFFLVVLSSSFVVANMIVIKGLHGR